MSRCNGRRRDLLLGRSPSVDWAPPVEKEAVEGRHSCELWEVELAVWVAPDMKQVGRAAKEYHRAPEDLAVRMHAEERECQCLS